MKQFKKKNVLSILLAVLLAAGTMTACSGEPTDSENSSGNSTNDSSKTDTTRMEETTPIRIIMFGDTTPRRTEYMENELHDRVMEDLNIDLTVEFLPWDSQNPQLMLAGGEDFATQSGMAGGFAQAVSKGWFAELTEEQINTYCPDLLKIREPHGLDAVKFNNKIYGVPIGNKPYSGENQVLMVREDLMEEAGIEDITNIDELNAAFKAVKEKHPDYTMLVEPRTFDGYLRGVINPGKAMDMIPGIDYVYVDSLAEDDKVYSYFESEAFKKHCEINREWNEMGIITADGMANPSQGIADWKAGRAFAYAGTAARIMEETPGLKANVPNVKLKNIRLGDAPRTYFQDNNVCYSISAESPHPEAYLMFLNWMFSSQEVYDFLAYGVEGKDYQLQGEKVEKLVSDNFWDEWQIFNLTNGRYNVDVSDDFIESYKKWDDDAIASKALGFNMDTSMLSTELSMMDAVMSETIKPMALGFQEYNEAAIQELKDAGLDKYMEEAQKQFSEWYKNQK